MYIKTINNHLIFDNCNLSDLAKEYKTPLFVYSENMIIDKCKQVRNSFLKKYENTRVAYAGKAFLTLSMCKILQREGFGLDVVSGGELYTAIVANFPPEMIEFNGNNKSIDEIEMAIDYKIGRIIVDNLTELGLVERVCEEKNTTVNILYRITPGVEIDTHKYITTGGKDSKFGIPLNEEIIYPAIEKAINSKFVNFLGFHFHVGSQLHSNKSHLSALETSLALMKNTQIKYNYLISELNIGGGFGIKYTSDDKPKDLSYFIEPIMNRIEAFCIDNKYKRPHVVMEPGRFIVGEAGVTLYTIGSIKVLPGTKKYISIDGGMTDNIRPALYQAKYEAEIANKMKDKKTDLVSICGKCCESSDIIIEDINLPPAETGDILAVFSTGAYGYSMASHYNKLLTPSVVLINDGTSDLIVQRENYNNMISNELLPDKLR